MKKIYILTTEEAGTTKVSGDFETTNTPNALTVKEIEEAHEVFVEVPSGLFVMKSRVKECGSFIKRSEMHTATVNKEQIVVTDRVNVIVDAINKSGVSSSYNMLPPTTPIHSMLNKWCVAVNIQELNVFVKTYGYDEMWDMMKCIEIQERCDIIANLIYLYTQYTDEDSVKAIVFIYTKLKRIVDDIADEE